MANFGMTATMTRRGCVISIDTSNDGSETEITVHRMMDESEGETVIHKLYNPGQSFGFDYDDSIEIERIIDKLLDKYGDPDGPVMKIATSNKKCHCNNKCNDKKKAIKPEVYNDLYIEKKSNKPKKKKKTTTSLIDDLANTDASEMFDFLDDKDFNKRLKKKDKKKKKKKNKGGFKW